MRIATLLSLSLMIALLPHTTTAQQKKKSNVFGKILLDGKPLANASTNFHYANDNTKSPIKGRSDAKGNFTTRKDVPPGKYIVTCTCFVPSKKPGVALDNLVPSKYASPRTSGLVVEVNKGKNEFILRLKSK